MSWRDSLRIAFHGIAANRLRSALTVLGILIGVASVIMLVAVGTGSSQDVQTRIESLGTNTLTVIQRPSFFGGGATPVQLTIDDVKDIEDDFNAPDVKSVAPTVSAPGTAAAYQGLTYSPSQTTGTTTEYFKIRNFEPSMGTLFTKQDERNHRKVVVIGQTVADNLFAGQNPVGSLIKLGDGTWEIVGVTKPKGSNGFQDQDDVVFAPITSVRDNLTGNSRKINGISVQAESRDALDAAQAEVTSILNSNHNITNPAQSGFLVQNQDSLLDTSDETSSVFTTLLGAVAAISLLVGGIGVMNIMLVTVTERTREIGIRKAVGATHGAILVQFLFEAVLLSIVGGFLGVAAGLIGSKFEVVGIQPVVATYSIPLAFGVAVAVGLFFGIYPANRAASLRPIEALRHE